MKLEVETSNTITRGNVVTRDFKIGDPVKVIRLLSSTIYSNKILAPIRELVCNAHDAHVAAGTTDKRYRVHLPTSDNPEFSIRDYGTGLDDDEIIELYTSYGSSTKDKDNTEIGCFGLGSKSPFAYTDRFEVSAYKNGILNIYQCIFEGSDIKIHRMGSLDTTEANGLEVKFQVKSSDINAFHREMNAMFMFQNEIEFIGDTYVMWRKLPEFTMNFAPNHNGDGWYVEMGGILYQITDSAFLSLPTLGNIKRAVGWDKKYIIHVDLGEIDMTVSREQVEWTPKSITAVERKAKQLLNGVEKIVKDKLRSKGTLCEKIACFYDIHEDYPFYKPKWYTNFIKRFYVSRGAVDTKIKLVTNGTTRSSRQCAQALENTIQAMTMFKHPEINEWVDLGERGQVVASIRAYSDAHGTHRIYCTSDAEILKLINRLGIKVKTVDDFKDWEPEKAHRVRVAKDKKDNVSSWLPGVRKYTYDDRAPDALTEDKLKALLNRTGTLYYTVQEFAHRVLPDVYLVALEAPGSFYDTTYKEVYCAANCNSGLLVVTEKGLAGLKKMERTVQLVNIKEEVERHIKGNDKVIKTLTRARLIARIRSEYSEWRFVCDLLKPILSVIPKEDQEHFSWFCRDWDKATDEEADVNWLDRTLFFRHCENERDTQFWDFQKLFREHIERQFPLLYSFIQYSSRISPKWSKEDIRKDVEDYVKSKVAKIKKEARNANLVKTKQTAITTNERKNENV